MRTKQIKVHVFRAAMCGGGLQYDVYVPIEHVPDDSWKAHEEKARREMLLIAAQAFPELAKVQAKTDKLPTLWVNNLMLVEKSAMVPLDIEVPI